ncbi:MHYT domain-containing protein [Sabulicella rubraurantiaca]|uniref:MHYT domain-containing protein n=1 Tax=Sabulicella rubraurantiaca TaxID=2811429 RepID=UPI001A97A0E6|nr:MHYT domain-containing protein [Sabulicella rubraurantiaca]
MNGHLLSGSHDPLLVTLSVAVAIAASFAALDLAGRARATADRWTSSAWVTAAALTLGGGIWSMHFVGMLAFQLPIPVAHDPGFTALSLAIAVLVTGLGFAVVRKRRGSLPNLVLGGVLMGCGVAGMHYTGIAAMLAPAELRLDGSLVAASVLMAVFTATAALWLARRDAAPGRRLGAAAIMGLAISGMHYTGMAAVTWAPHAGLATAETHASTAGLAIGVAAITFLALLLALIAASFDRRLALIATREARDALAESEARFRAVVEQAGTGIAQSDRHGYFLMANDRYCEIVCRSREELLDRRLRMQDITHPDDLANNLPAFARIVREGVPFSIEKRYLRPDGTEVWVNNSVAPVRDAEGQVLSVVAVAHDVTARRAAEAALEQERADLERLVEARTAALLNEAEERRRAEEAARQAEKLAALGQLTGGVAHDFGNLMQIVSSGVELLGRPSLPDAKKAEILEGMRQAASSARELTSRLLAYARQQTLRAEVFDVGARLTGMLEILRKTLGATIQVEADFSAELWPVCADPSQLEVAILNLPVNARDSMPHGGTLTLQARNVAQGATAQRTGGEYVCIAVKDTGEGIPPHILSRVLEPFFTTKKPGRGTGLGLPQAHGFAKQSGGDLHIESKPGCGTVVFFYLPRAAADLAEVETADLNALREEPSVLQGIGRSVLVVDDTPDVAAFACSLLEELGYETRRAGSAAEALMLLREGAVVDAVFSDVVMPGGMDGVELATVLRSSFPHVAVVLATGYSERLARSGSVEGVEALLKPYRLDDLGCALGRALAKTKGTLESAAAGVASLSVS